MIIKDARKIILEGVDGAGKNYLADKIQQYYPYMDYSVVSCSRHTPNTFEYFKKLLLSDENIIFNRFCYGQFVYQNSEDRKRNNWMTTSELLKLENIMNYIGCQVVYVKSDLNKCLYHSKRDRDDSYYTLDYLKELSSKYEYYFSTISELDKNTLVYYNNNYELDMSDDMSDDNEVTEFKWDANALPKIVAVDFDDCLVTGAVFPEIGKINEKIRHLVFEGEYKDYKKILWTSRNGKNLIDAVTFCQDNGLYFDEYNRNIEEVRKMTGGDTRKVFADVYLDDKALNSYDVEEVTDLEISDI